MTPVNEKEPAYYFLYSWSTWGQERDVVSATLTAAPDRPPKVARQDLRLHFFSLF